MKGLKRKSTSLVITYRVFHKDCIFKKTQTFINYYVYITFRYPRYWIFDYMWIPIAKIIQIVFSEFLDIVKLFLIPTNQMFIDEPKILIVFEHGKEQSPVSLKKML